MGKHTMAMGNRVHCALPSISFLQIHDNGKERNKNINVNFCFIVNLVLVLGPWFPLISFRWWSKERWRRTSSRWWQRTSIFVGAWLEIEVEVIGFVTEVGGWDLRCKATCRCRPSQWQCRLSPRLFILDCVAEWADLGCRLMVAP